MSYDHYSSDDIRMLSECRLCPRECRADRFSGGAGYCRSDAGMNIASICVHRGEEPPVSGPDGICNIFFSGCNLRCVFCQNHEISRSSTVLRSGSPDYLTVIEDIIKILDKGIKAVGFVSPSHVVPQVKAIIRGLNCRGYFPVTVYNTNGYDREDIIDSLDGIIDVYLPDIKYVTPVLSQEYSGSFDYPDVALKALRRMYYQKGSTLRLDDEGRVENGILIRHLMLPGHLDETRSVLRMIAEEISTGVHISLMSQYHPIPSVMDHPELKRILYLAEYESAVEEMNKLGFRNGWVQDMDSYRNYKPDFTREHPFE